MSEVFIPVEAERYLAKKKLKPSFDFRDTWKQEHDHSFVVAKMNELDLLQTVHEAVVNAIADGETLATFRKTLTPHLISKGWWGKQVMQDPLTGENKAVQLGSDARIKRIYQTNMRTAYAAGQWESAQRTKTALPFLLYQLGPSREHRKEHMAWHNLLLPVDHPFWQSHFPPNGWGCKCRARQVTQAEAQALIASGSVTTQAPPVNLRAWQNRRTGEIEHVPQGIDPGWDYAPGASLPTQAQQLLTKAANMAPSLASPVISQALANPAIANAIADDFKEATTRVHQEMAQGIARPQGRTWAMGTLSSEVLMALDKLNVKPVSAIIAIDDASVMHMLRDAKGKRKRADASTVDKRLPLEWLQALPMHLQKPIAILHDKNQHSPTLLFVYDFKNVAGKLIIKIDYTVKTQDGKIKMNMIRSGEVGENKVTLKDKKMYELLWGEI